jgi:hypothetical protein
MAGISEPFLSQIEGGERLGYQCSLSISQALNFPVDLFTK